MNVNRGELEKRLQKLFELDYDKEGNIIAWSEGSTGKIQKIFEEMWRKFPLGFNEEDGGYFIQGSKKEWLIKVLVATRDWGKEWGGRND